MIEEIVGAEVTTEFATGVDISGKKTGAEIVCTKEIARTVTSERAMRRRKLTTSFSMQVTPCYSDLTRPVF